jgi:metal-sulfur cluster biosynthetic enzyme
MDFTENQVVEILRKVIHPVSGRDIVTLNLVNALKVEGSRISFSLEFTSFNDPLKSSLKKACIRILQENLGNSAEIEIDIKIPAKPEGRGKRQYLPVFVTLSLLLPAKVEWVNPPLRLIWPLPLLPPAQKSVLSMRTSMVRRFPRC